jgi:Protein of unknown function (DUF2637)
MNSPLPASWPAKRRNWSRLLVNVLVALVVIAVAGATFVFSYDGVHAVALLGGVSARLARYYPGLFDAVLVIACVAAVMLRDGQWWARLWAWVVIVVLLAAIGTTDVLHAMNYTLRHRPTEGIVAAAPVVAVLLAFSLLLTLLRQSRTQAQEQTGPGPLGVPALPASVTVPIALPAAPVTASPSASASARTEALPVLREDTLPGDVPPTREEPVLARATEEPHAWEVPTRGAPTREVPAAEGPADERPADERPADASPADEETPARDEPAPPTVQVPALSPEPPPGEAAPTRVPQGIRYAGNGVPGMAGKQQADERDAPRDDDYWEPEEAGQFAGLVYPAREDHPDAEDAADDSDDVSDDSGDAETDEPGPRKDPPELDDDAPPFATAPFAPVPRLNRVRSTPTPPADEDE